MLSRSDISYLMHNPLIHYRVYIGPELNQKTPLCTNMYFFVEADFKCLELR
jgi:hypothetical protein